MNRIAGITFNTNANVNEVGFMEYVTGTTKDYHYSIKRYSSKSLKDRYFIEHEGVELNLSHYVDDCDLYKVDKLYQKKQKCDHIVFFIIQINKWGEFNKKLEKELV
ncbi:hypothetical protein [Staphylococcus saprophyticus]|uniref:hypothetical protein n=1 Tax=Staphylococcus saprophyticus TaxID=29385 RepID=UPI0034C6A65A